eukprot:TRINITY_DN5358_c0_g1_i2.p1 TRINITY_DN5358_c0_g1~~TRINITY_DN5358_c0_g1_i2.p1  ORF type:complete len:122 (-),score=27.74 TRINITY_DN5358_c0_g1_i2:211-576(-)
MSENSSQEEEPVSKRSKTGVFSQEEIECNIQQKYEEILERSEQMCTSLHNAINEAHSVFANDLRIILETKQSEYDNLYAVYLDKEAMLERALASLRMFSGIELDFEEEEEGKLYVVLKFHQ